MFSNRQARSWPRRRSLRSKLIAVQVGLLAVICLIVGAVTLPAVNAFLLGQLDQEVRDATYRAADFAVAPRGSPPHDGHGPANPGGARGLKPRTVTAFITGGAVDADLQSATAQPEPLPGELDSVLRSVPVDSRAHTRELGELGSYRLYAKRTSDGDVVVAGLPLAGVQETLRRVGFTLVAVAAAGLVVTGIAGALVVRRTLRPLERVALVATRVTELPLDRGEVTLPVHAPDSDPGTEVGRVGVALNRMLRHVGSALAARQASEDRMRRFIADASHELRTPLASIRGYAELTRRFGNRVPSDVRYAMGRVEAESTRMTTLVEELLLLAKLDAGRAPVREPVDLSRLIVDAVADAQVAGADHRWLLELPAEPVLVAGDADQLHQAILNLLTNGRIHTPAGSTVRTALSTGDGMVRLTVTDDGPGIPAEVLPEVFERFARADTSRSRAAGSTGLGLAIVAAVVAAHGGTAQATSRPGHTAFTVTLPATDPPAGG